LTWATAIKLSWPTAPGREEIRGAGRCRAASLDPELRHLGIRGGAPRRARGEDTAPAAAQGDEPERVDFQEKQAMLKRLAKAGVGADALDGLIKSWTRTSSQ
jgi:hypothetical protein